jgi:hypothetical protein
MSSLNSPNPQTCSDYDRAERRLRETAGRELAARGVSDGETRRLLQASTATNILGWCRWFDRQPEIGAGALVVRVRSGQPAPPERRDSDAQQRRYEQQIVRWLGCSFPQLIDPRWGAHPAAVAAVVRLHHACGKGHLTRREHGAAILAAVAEWDRRHGAGTQAVEPRDAQQ